MLFFLPVRLLRLACFSIGHFLLFLVPGSSLLVPLLISFSVRFAFLFHALVSQESSSSSLLLLPRLLQGLLPFLSRVQCSWVCCLCWRSVQGVVVLPFGVLSLVFVCFALVLSACSPVSSGFRGSWLWCLLKVHSWSFLLVVGAFRVFIHFVMFVSFFWFPCLSAGVSAGGGGGGGCCCVFHSSSLVSIFVAL